MLEQLLNSAYTHLAQIGSDAKKIGSYLANFDGSISASVGKGGVNHPQDVLAVRLLLNAFISNDNRMRPLSTLDLGPPIQPANPMDPTITAITWFQKQVAGFQSPDGRVEPNKKTHNALRGFKSKLPAPKPKVDNPIPELGARPVLVTDEQIKNLKPGGSVTINTLWTTGVVSAGETWNAADGDRVIYAACSSYIIFVLLKPRNGAKAGTYIQPVKWFQEDVNRGSVGAEVSGRCQSIRKLMLIELQFLMGIGCAISTPAALFMLGSELGPFISQHYHKWPAYWKIIKLLPGLTSLLYTHAPELLKYVFKALVYKLLDHAGNSFDDPEKVAKLAGGLVGKLGIAGFEGSLKALGFTLGVLKDLLVFVITNSGKLAAQETAARIQVIRELAKRAGNVIDEPTAGRILGEIIRSAAVLTPLVTELHTEIKRLGL